MQLHFAPLSRDVLQIRDFHLNNHWNTIRHHQYTKFVYLFWKQDIYTQKVMGCNLRN